VLALELGDGELQREVLRRRLERSRTPAGEPPLPAPLRAALTAVAREQSELDYAIELRLVTENLVSVHESWTDVVRPLRPLSAAEQEALAAALALSRAPVEPEATLVFVVCSFARNALLFGPRGYRRTLLEAGQVVRRFLDAAAAAGLRAAPRHEYADHAVDEALDVDGIEEGCVAAIVVEAR
jgi:hypothetical protein